MTCSIKLKCLLSLSTIHLSIFPSFSSRSCFYFSFSSLFILRKWKKNHKALVCTGRKNNSFLIHYLLFESLGLYSVYNICLVSLLQVNEWSTPQTTTTREISIFSYELIFIKDFFYLGKSEISTEYLNHVCNSCIILFSCIDFFFKHDLIDKGMNNIPNIILMVFVYIRSYI